MDKEEFLKSMNDFGINFGKSPASRNHTLQPCERSDLFKPARVNIENPNLQAWEFENKRYLMEDLKENSRLNHSGIFADTLDLFSHG